MCTGRGVAACCSTTEFQSIVVALLFVLVAILDRDQYLFSGQRFFRPPDPFPVHPSNWFPVLRIPHPRRRAQVAHVLRSLLFLPRELHDPIALLCGVFPQPSLCTLGFILTPVSSR